MSETRTIRPFGAPGHTQFDNNILDYIMPRISASAWKILCFVIRKTWGWEDKDSPTGRKERDEIAYSQMREGTGIRSDTTISRALDELVDHEHPERGYLLREPAADHKQGWVYRLNIGLELTITEDGTLSTSPESGEVKAETSPESGEVKPETSPESGEVKLETSPENGDTKERVLNKPSKEKGASCAAPPAPADKAVSTRSPTDLPDATTQAEILFAGRTPAPGDGDLQGAEARLLTSGWNIRSRAVKDAVIYLLHATGWEVPVTQSERNDWHKSLKEHAEAFGTSNLPALYAEAHRRMRQAREESGLTYPPRPGALTRTMQAVREEQRESGRSPAAPVVAGPVRALTFEEMFS
jgi:hypothetical protein